MKTLPPSPNRASGHLSWSSQDDLLEERFAARFMATALVCLCVGTATAVTPTAAEMAQARRWEQAAFGAATLTDPPHFDLVFEDAPDSVTRGKSWRGTPFQIGERTYTHGLAFNSTKQLRVHLGKPAERFTADVGLENNDDTQRGAAIGNGSVSFHVIVAGKEVATTPVMRLRDRARALDVPLDGAQEFEIRVGDGGDGRGWDQALWAEATVKLRDGTTLRLQDLPWGDEAGANPHLVSFLLNGQPSATLLSKWTRTAQAADQAPLATSRVVTYADPNSGVQMRVEATAFSDFPAVEWVAYFKNTARTNSPLLEGIQALDAPLPTPGSGASTLHWAKGAVASFDDFAPQETAFKPGKTLHLQPGGGRSSSQVLPFFNLDSGAGGV